MFFEYVFIRISARKEMRSPAHLLPLTEWHFRVRVDNLLIFAFWDSRIRGSGRGQREKNAATRAMRKSKCRGIPSKPAIFTEYGTLRGRMSDGRECSWGDSATK